jgi:hypothetical protein
MRVQYIILLFSALIVVVTIMVFMRSNKTVDSAESDVFDGLLLQFNTAYHKALEPLTELLKTCVKNKNCSRPPVGWNIANGEVEIPTNIQEADSTMMNTLTQMSGIMIHNKNDASITKKYNQCLSNYSTFLKHIRTVKCVMAGKCKFDTDECKPITPTV